MLRNALFLSLASAALGGCLTGSDSEEAGAGLRQPWQSCPRIMCALYCENGFASDEDGCPICQCNPDPVECPDVVCALWCPNGMKTDDNGCSTCECNDEPTCEDVGGTCEVSPFDPGFAADCEGELGMDTGNGTCEAFNASCCVPREPEGEACGGFAGFTCSRDDEYCAYAPDAMCGAADQMGTCTPRPEACIELYEPVCGCDGETYSNSCFAASAGTSVAHDGECEPPPSDCREDGCGRGQYCSFCWGSYQCLPRGAVC